MLQRIHNILAWITINTKTEASIWALKLQTIFTNRWPHLNPSTKESGRIAGLKMYENMFGHLYSDLEE